MLTKSPRAIHEFTAGADPNLCGYRGCGLPRSNPMHDIPAGQRKFKVDENLKSMKKELYAKLAAGKRRKG
jgi:hypothetical protein